MATSAMLELKISSGMDRQPRPPSLHAMCKPFGRTCGRRPCHMLQG